MQNNIAKFEYQNGLICFKLNLRKASNLILKSLNKNSKNLVSYIKTGKEHKNKTVLSNDDGTVFNLEKKYLSSYHMDIYTKISKFLNYNERKWLSSLI